MHHLPARLLLDLINEKGTAPRSASQRDDHHCSGNLPFTIIAVVAEAAPALPMARATQKDYGHAFQTADICIPGIPRRLELQAAFDLSIKSSTHQPRLPQHVYNKGCLQQADRFA